MHIVQTKFFKCINKCTNPKYYLSIGIIFFNTRFIHIFVVNNIILKIKKLLKHSSIVYSNNIKIGQLIYPIY